jgi:hypothetical protein
METRVSHILGKHFTTELLSQTNNFILSTYFFFPNNCILDDCLRLYLLGAEVCSVVEHVLSIHKGLG